MAEFIDELKATIEATVRELSAEIETNGPSLHYHTVQGLALAAEKNGRINAYMHVLNLIGNADKADSVNLSVQFRTGGHRGERFPLDQRENVNERLLDAVATGRTIKISGVPVDPRDIQYWQWEDEEHHHARP